MRGVQLWPQRSQWHWPDDELLTIMVGFYQMIIMRVNGPLGSFLRQLESAEQQRAQADGEAFRVSSVRASAGWRLILVAVMFAAVGLAAFRDLGGRFARGPSVPVIGIQGDHPLLRRLLPHLTQRSFPRTLQTLFSPHGHGGHSID